MATKYLKNKSGDLFLNCTQLRGRRNYVEAPEAEADFETVEAEAPKPKKKVAKKVTKKKAEVAAAEGMDGLEDWD